MTTETYPIWVDDIYKIIDPETVRFVHYDQAIHRVTVRFFNGIIAEFFGDRDTERILASVFTDRLYIEETYINTIEEAREVIDYYA